MCVRTRHLAGSKRSMFCACRSRDELLVLKDECLVDETHDVILQKFSNIQLQQQFVLVGRWLKLNRRVASRPFFMYIGVF